MCSSSSYSVAVCNWCNLKRGVAILPLLLSLISPSEASTAHSEDQCLANAIYYEANGESLKGKRAVLDVIHHRMLESGKTACQIIKQRGQFSWYGKKPMKRYTTAMQELLSEVNDAPKVLINEKYKYFFNKHIRPHWSVKLDCRRIGNHMFCKER